MYKYILFLSSALILILSVACSTTGSSGKIVKLNPTEYKQLEVISKNTILNMPSSKVSKAEKKYVTENTPLFRVRYTGYKRGKYSFTWTIFTGKVLQVCGNGDMLNFRRSFNKITVSSLNVDKPKKD